MDFEILLWIRDHLHNPVTEAVFPVISFLGNAGLIWLLTAVVLLCFRRSRRAGVLVIVALAVTYVCNDLIFKQLVERPRPFLDHPELGLLIDAPSSWSFPSGHSASSFAAAAVLLWETGRPIGVAALVTAALIAFSRAFLFVHYPSDILIGSLIGFAIGSLCVLAARRLAEVRSRRLG